MFNKDKHELEIQLLKAMSDKITAEARLEALTSTLEDKQREIVRLLTQVERLQDALVAASAPRAYEDRRADQADPPSEESIKEARRLRDQAKINADLLQEMERPMFKDATDMMEQLMGAQAVQQMLGGGSTHGNSES